MADDYQGTAETMLRHIPGYSSYKDKELARDSDRALRDRIAQQLDANATRVEAVQRAAAVERNTQKVKELEPVVQGFRNTANLVRSLSYGYSGLFSDSPVDDVALAQLRIFDEGLMVKATAFKSTVDGLDDHSEIDADALTNEIASFKAMLDARGTVISEGRPARPIKALTPSPAVQKAFDSGDTPPESTRVLPEVDLGDAMSILGDDHLVEALIDVETDKTRERFIRLDNTPQMWLWISSVADRTPQRLVSTEIPSGIQWSEYTGKAQIHVPDERRTTASGVIRTGSNGNEQYVQLDVAGAAHTFVATDVHADDIETYRAK